MKILKNGNKVPYDEREYLAKCKSCGCQFSYKEKNKYFTYDGEEYVFCPQCKFSVSVSIFNRRIK